MLEREGKTSAAGRKINQKNSATSLHACIKYAKVNSSAKDWIHGNAFKVRVLMGRKMFTMITFAGDPDAIYSRLLKQKENRHQEESVFLHLA